MIDRPDRTGDSLDDDDESGDRPLVSCAFQDGTLDVYSEWLHIERPDRSAFDDTAIELNDVRGVTYEKRLVISYLQIETDAVDPDEASLFSTPVDENTLHFGRGKRDCARRARAAIRDGAGL